MKAATFSTLTLSLALTAGAATIIPIRLSDEPRATTVSTNDDVILNATNNGTATWTTKRATVQKVIEAALPAMTNVARGQIQLGGIILTNFKAVPSAGALSSYSQFTNQVSAGWPATNQWTATNSVDLIHYAGYTNPAGNGEWTRFRERYLAPNGSYFENLWNPYHETAHPESNAGASEMQTTSRGGWAVSFNYNNTDYSTYNESRRAWQWGIGGYGQPYIYHQASLIKNAVNTNLFGAMLPEFFKARVYTNTGSSVWAGSLAPESTDIMPAKWFHAIDTNGNAALDYYENLNSSVNTANGNWQNEETAVKPLRIIFGPSRGIDVTGSIRSEGTAGITTNWTVSAGDRVTIKNGLIVGLIRAFQWDTDATNYAARIGTATTTALVTNLDTMFKALKPDGTYTNLQGFYLFCGANSASNAQNLVSSSYTITWGGSVTNDTTGLQGDGTSGYGDTGWKPSTNGFVFVWIKTGMIGSAYRCPAHVRDGSNSRFGLANNSSQNWVYYVNDNDGQGATYPTYPSSICVVRSGITARKFYKGGDLTPFPDEVTTPMTPPNYNLFVLARNTTGSADSFYDGKIQALAFGTNSITAAQYKTLHDAVSAFNAAQGR